MYEKGQLVSKNNKSHLQGICDLVFVDEWKLYSGGFDGILCSYDIRKMSEHLSLHNYGGTIWRIIPSYNK